MFCDIHELNCFSKTAPSFNERYINYVQALALALSKHKVPSADASSRFLLEVPLFVFTMYDLCSESCRSCRGTHVHS